METTKPKEMFHEDTKAAEQAAKNNHSTIMDNYHAQLTGVAGMYAGFFNNMTKLFPQPFHIANNGFQNHDLLAAFTNKGNNNPSDLSKKYKEAIDSHLEVSKNIFKSTVEANKKMIEDAHTHFNLAINQTQSFWNQILKTSDKPLTEEDAYANESGINDKTKKTTAPINEVKDQKEK